MTPSCTSFPSLSAASLPPPLTMPSSARLVSWTCCGQPDSNPALLRILASRVRSRWQSCKPLLRNSLKPHTPQTRAASPAGRRPSCSLCTWWARRFPATPWPSLHPQRDCPAGLCSLEPALEALGLPPGMLGVEVTRCLDCRDPGRAAAVQGCCHPAWWSLVLGESFLALAASIPRPSGWACLVAWCIRRLEGAPG